MTRFGAALARLITPAAVRRERLQAQARAAAELLAQHHLPYPTTGEDHPQ